MFFSTHVWLINGFEIEKRAGFRIFRGPRFRSPWLNVYTGSTKLYRNEIKLLPDMTLWRPAIIKILATGI